jgi:hypothetical protein
MEGRQRFFLKKEAKTFASDAATWRAQKQKFFGSFFQKRTFFLNDVPKPAAN